MSGICLKIESEKKIVNQYKFTQRKYLNFQMYFRTFGKLTQNETFVSA